MFVDEAVIFCAAGTGGKGCQSLDRSRPQHYKATGGAGGGAGLFKSSCWLSKDIPIKSP